MFYSIFKITKFMMETETETTIANFFLISDPFSWIGVRLRAAEKNRAS